MTAIDRTAYSRFKEPYTNLELRNLYTPTPEEIIFAQNTTDSDSQRLTLLVWLKCCQSLGYIPRLKTVPTQVVEHVRVAAGLKPYYQKIGLAVDWQRVRNWHSRMVGAMAHQSCGRIQ